VKRSPSSISVSPTRSSSVVIGSVPNGSRPARNRSDGNRLPADPSKRDRIASRRESAKANLTDPDSRMIKAPGRYLQGYSCQAIVGANQIILAGQVTNQQNDNDALAPMLHAARTQLKAAGGDPDQPRVLLADKGYWNHQTIDEARSW
jgi:hypothetical protein